MDNTGYSTCTDPVYPAFFRSVGVLVDLPTDGVFALFQRAAKASPNEGHHHVSFRVHNAAPVSMRLQIGTRPTRGNDRLPAPNTS